MNRQEFQAQIEYLEKGLRLKRLPEETANILFKDVKWWSASKFESVCQKLIRNYEGHLFPAIATILKAGEEFQEKRHEFKREDCTSCNNSGFIIAFKFEALYNRHHSRALRCQCHFGQEKSQEIQTWNEELLQKGYLLENPDDLERENRFKEQLQKQKQLKAKEEYNNKIDALLDKIEVAF